MSPAPAEPQDDGAVWLSPFGGLGDALICSGVLKQVADAFPDRKYNLVRRTKYLPFLKGHPAIAAVGYPPKGAAIQGLAYWNLGQVGPGLQRPFQILARSFGLTTPVEEALYLPGDLEEDPILDGFIPWKKRNILIAPASDSPRKMMHPEIWHRLTDLLLRDGALVLQAGRQHELHIRNTYSVLGLTTPRQLVALVKKCDLVITPDNFIMHAAHLVGTPAVALWGPTHHEVYGYPGQLHIQAPKGCGLGPEDSCYLPAAGGVSRYAEACPFKGKHCLDQLRPEEIHRAAREMLSR